MKRPIPARWLTIALLVGACDPLTTITGSKPDVCGPYPDPATSPYRLPFPVGEASTIAQGNCGPFTHAGGSRYAYDFAMTPGRTVVAARDGVVLELFENFVDGVDHQLNSANRVRIEHADGTIGTYVHLQQDGVLVEVGAAVVSGQPIAILGFTGFTGPNPHLHFQVNACESGCETVPVSFSNASPAAPGGLQAGVTYTAAP
jgi:murein DD-endopeptidase MepM/ murein hydrolase activator NlpD